MDEARRRLFNRRNVGSLGDNLPYDHGKDSSFSSNFSNMDPKEIEKIINISLSGNRQVPNRARSGSFQNSNQPCQTTINLYINDPHMIEKHLEKYRKTPPRRRMRNEIVLGKNIPDHTLMKNLLGDLAVKKYSSAPEMTNKYMNPKRKILPSERFSSDRSFTDSTEVLPDLPMARNWDVGPDKGTTLLYVNEGRSGGDFMRSKIGDIKEEDEEKAVKDENNCPVHSCDHSVVKVSNGDDVKEEETCQPNLKDPLKRFKRKPFRASQFSKNPGILYRDIIASKPNRNEKIEQPRRTVPSFNVRTQMVRDVLNANPELLQTYQSGLMKNHKRLFESLRHKSFQSVLREKSALEKKESLPKIRKSGEIDQMDIKQSKLILSGKNKQPICSVESHGPYEEYRKNLVEGPDGILCCKNIEGTKNDDVWSRAETRSMITREFVKDKVKKFDKLLNKNAGGVLEVYVGPQKSKREEMNTREDYEIAKHSFQGTLSHNLLNGESVKFPKETKNAMTRLLSKNSRILMENQNREDEKKTFATLREIRNMPLQKRDSADSSTSCLDSVESNVKTNS